MIKDTSVKILVVFSPSVFIAYGNNPRILSSPQNQRRIKGVKTPFYVSLKIGNLIKYFNLLNKKI